METLNLEGTWGVLIQVLPALTESRDGQAFGGPPVVHGRAGYTHFHAPGLACSSHLGSLQMWGVWLLTQDAVGGRWAE